jgi:dihydroceramide fatty acyl 2-hydroxylase
VERSEAQSIRLFSNDLMESLTHVHPIIPLLLWAPIASLLLWRTFAIQALPPGPVLVVACCALVMWTLTEYCVHRFVFHFPARSRPGKWLVHLFHGVHHDVPRDATRLLMPPAGSIMLMALFLMIFRVFVPAIWFEPFCAFFIIGYLVYDYIHYATHFLPMRSALPRLIKKHHMQHHFTDPNRYYGVSTPLWDSVFKTGSKL